tara:strand:- start:7652 stop:8044 length:393 start_codon:yes stop_codon:yes gene_type:complete
MTAGRPSKLTDALIEQAGRYASKEYLLHGEVIPTIEGLSVYLNVSRKTLYNWKAENEEFLHILDDLMARQAKELFSNGLTGDFNPTITKLILTKHGYSDRVEQDVTSSDGALAPTSIVLRGVRADDSSDD